MTPAAQAKLLRIVEYKEFERLGGEKTINTDVRIIAATNRKIQNLVNEGIFRKDLYYRISDVVVVVPPLRERIEDIPKFIESSLADFNRKFKKCVRGISDDVLNFFYSNAWPGNVRELRNLIRSAVALAEADTITFDDLKHTGIFLESEPETGGDDLSLAGMEKEHIKRVLKLTGNNKTKAAEILGISRSTLARKIEEYSI
jgi:transcriptional regulator with PAS, ATPase and Fis domain